MKKELLFFIAILCLQLSSIAQCIPSVSEYMEGTKVKTIIHNGGDFGWDFYGMYGNEIPKVTNPGLAKHAGGPTSL